jgi:competence ComEA-like helix-hairpin-helix protein
MVELRQVQLAAFRAAVVIAVIFCLCFSLGGAVTNKSSGTIELEHRINPNVAPATSLMRLPGIGLARAQAIVAYRERFCQSGKGDLAFRDCNDLKNIKGIGPASVDDMCDWLRFK